MNEIERKLNSNLFDNERIEKMRHQNIRSINSIENLSNEIFYEIFDYLNAYHINEAFSNLNHRFQQLLNSSSFLLKVKMDHSTSQEIYMKNYQKIFRHNKHQIISICPLIIDDNHIISTFNINSSFINLQSLVCWLMEVDILRLILPRLAYLPSLISLFINTGDALNDLYEIYYLIFELSKLKYFKFTATSTDDSDIIISLPNANDNSMSPIEYLIIDHPCTFNELFSIISYTPQLYHLSFIETGDYDDDNLNIENLSSNFLPNLTYISIESFNINFDELEIFLQKLPTKLKYFSLKTCTEDKKYLNANRWKEFILKYLPNLEKFYLYYSVYYHRNSQRILYAKPVNQFISSFWIEQKWIYDIEIDFDEIIHSIHPYKKRWYDEDNNTIDDSKPSRLTLKVSHNKQFLVLLIRNISHKLSIGKIYHLKICIQISHDILIEILKSFIYLDSLNLSSLLLLKNFDKDINFQCDSIRKVYLEILNDINELNVLMKICPQMTYLKIHLINNINIQTFLRYILRKIQNESNIYLRLLYIRVPAIDDKIIDRLIRMINSEELLFNYTIKRILDNIYLQGT